MCNTRVLPKFSQMSNEVHLIPCKILYDGTAKIEEYFYSNKMQFKAANESSPEILSATFRGKPLLGAEITLPRSYSLYSMTFNKESSNDETPYMKVPIIESQHKVDKFIYWNFDSEPNSKDAVQKAVGWITVAEAIANDV